MSGCTECRRGRHDLCTGFDGPITTHPDSLPRCACAVVGHRSCSADITHRDEGHRQSVCIKRAGHSGVHDDGQGCTWTSGGVG